MYLKYDGSVQKVAEETFVHRNTINYQLAKIKKILGNNLKTFEAVSYTHLDVYKRQVLSCSLMGWIENGVSPLKRIERKSKKKKDAV